MMLRRLRNWVVLLGAMAGLAGCVVYESSTRPVPVHAIPRPIVEVDVGYFHDVLAPDGDWVRLEPYGWVWVPNAVGPFWRPYTVGRWEWTDWGWMWVSSERWGWATYHYGRWVRVSRHGWAWMPGDVWGPAWVAWRHGAGVVGWAPLPPQARFRVGVGLDWERSAMDAALDPDSWCFVDDVRFVDADLHRHAYPVGRNATVIHRTWDVTRLRVTEDRIVNEGVDRAQLERQTHRAIPMRRIVDTRSSGQSAQVGRDEVRVFRPQVRPGASPATPRQRIEPATSAPPPVEPAVDGATDERWDRRWLRDWRKLEKLQERDAPRAEPAPGRRAPAAHVLDQQRRENYEASQNAYRELVAERERAQRLAEREAKRVEAPPGRPRRPAAEAKRKSQVKGKKQEDR